MVLAGRVFTKSGQNSADARGVTDRGSVAPSIRIDDRPATHRGINGGSEPQNVHYDDRARPAPCFLRATHAPFEANLEAGLIERRH